MTDFDSIVSTINAGESRNTPLPEEIVLDDAGLRIGAIVRTDTSRFEPRITVGNRTKDSDALLSSWVQDDWSGGGLIYKHNEGATDSRFRWSTCWTLNRTQLALPPKRNSTSLAEDTSLDSYSGTMPIGRITLSGGSTPHVVVASTSKLHRLRNSDFASIDGPNNTVPVSNTGALFLNRLYYPDWGGVAYMKTDSTIVRETDISTRCVAVQTWDKRLFALQTDGYLRYLNVGGTWDTASANRKIPADQTPIDLCEWYDRSGNLTVFILTDSQLWGYDPESDTIVPTDIQWPRNAITCFAPWRSESLFIATGLGVERVTRDGVRTPMGLDRDYGLPSFILNVKDMAVRCMIGSRNALLAVAASSGLDESSDAYLMAWNESGWHCIGTIPQAQGGSLTPRMLITDGVGPDGKQYNLWIGGLPNKPLADFVLHAPCEVQRWVLSPNLHGPLQNIYRTVGEFELSAVHYTGWFDAGMEGFDKLLSHFEIEQTQPEGISWSSNVKVAVAYRTDADPDTWVALGTTSQFGINRFRFGVDSDNFSRGLGCNRVEFRYTFTSNTSTTTPVIDHTNMKFITLSQPGASWTADVPLDQENVNGLGPREISDWLAQATYSQSFMKMLHGTKTYRVRIAQHASNEGAGDMPFRRDSIVIVECPDGDD